jgi:signal recognition particle subunit SRP54
MPGGMPGGMPQLPPGFDPSALGGGGGGMPPGFKLPKLDFGKLGKKKPDDDA